MINLADKPFVVGDFVIRIVNGFTVGYQERVSDMFHTPNDNHWTFRTREDNMWRNSADWRKVKPLIDQSHD